MRWDFHLSCNSDSIAAGLCCCTRGEELSCLHRFFRWVAVPALRFPLCDALQADMQEQRSYSAFACRWVRSKTDADDWKETFYCGVTTCTTRLLRRDGTTYVYHAGLEYEPCCSCVAGERKVNER